MKVLHVYKTYYPEDFTGIPRVIHAIAEGTAALGIESHVLALTKGPSSRHPIQIDSHTVHQVKRDFQFASNDFSLGAFRVFRQLAASVDVINYHYPWPTGDLLRLFGGKTRPSVVTYHSDIVKQRHLLHLYSPLMHYLLRSADFIISTSPNYLESSSVLRTYQQKTEVIPIGIGARPPVDPDLRERWREKLGAGFFLFVGAARYYKGIAFLIEAAAQTGLPVVLAGDCKEIASATLTQNVVTLGLVTDEDKEVLLDLCSAFVLPSHLRSEAFGVALLEAARAGKPLISCEIGTGTSFVNIDKVTGLVVPSQSSSHLAAAMQHMSRNKASAAAMGREAAKRYQHLFTQEQMALSYGDIYARAIQRG